jgi:hypothetical protein
MKPQKQDQGGPPKGNPQKPDKGGQGKGKGKP